jgi:hypothetical protein
MSGLNAIRIHDNVTLKCEWKQKTLWNQPDFGGPNTGVTAGALFGQVTGSRGDPQRQILPQARLKF